jgi:hypothetical protein
VAARKDSAENEIKTVSNYHKLAEENNTYRERPFNDVIDKLMNIPMSYHHGATASDAS